MDLRRVSRQPYPAAGNPNSIPMVVHWKRKQGPCSALSLPWLTAMAQLVVFLAVLLLSSRPALNKLVAPDAGNLEDGVLLGTSWSPFVTPSTE